MFLIFQFVTIGIRFIPDPEHGNMSLIFDNCLDLVEHDNFEGAKLSSRTPFNCKLSMSISGGIENRASPSEGKYLSFKVNSASSLQQGFSTQVAQLVTHL